MKKNRFSAFLWLCSALFFIGFAAHLYFDYTLHYEYGSAPFWLYAAVRFFEFMLPAAGFLAAGIIVRRKTKEDERDEK